MPKDISKQYWLPRLTKFDKKTWEKLRGEDRISCVTRARNEFSQDVIAIVWSPDDDVDDIHYAALVAAAPVMLRILKKELGRNPEAFEDNRKLVEHMMRHFSND